MQRLGIHFLVILLLGLVFSGAGHADTYRIEAEDIGDGYYLYVNGPGKQWYGSANFIRASYSSYGGSSSEETGYTQYALSGAPDPSLIDSVTLNVYLDRKDNYCYGWIKYLPNATTANGNAAQRLNGTQTVGTISTSMSLGWHSFDVTDLIKTDLGNGISWAPFSFHSLHSNYAGFDIRSAESGYASYLEFNYTPVPLPGSSILLLGGIMGLVGLRRKRDS